MKKILLLPAILLTLLTGCSSDDAVTVNDSSAEEIAKFSTGRIGFEPQPFCFTSISAYTNINVSNGFGNPVVEFIADTDGAPRKTSYMVTLEVQPLSECEDMESNYGESLAFTYPQLVENPDQNMPVISLKPAELPAGCYKWRYIFQSASSKLACTSVSEWYEAPLF